MPIEKEKQCTRVLNNNKKRTVCSRLGVLFFYIRRGIVLNFV